MDIPSWVYIAVVQALLKNSTDTDIQIENIPKEIEIESIQKTIEVESIQKAIAIAIDKEIEIAIAIDKEIEIAIAIERIPKKIAIDIIPIDTDAEYNIFDFIPYDNPVLSWIIDLFI